MDLKSKIHELSASNLEQVVTWRRHIHQHPELSFQEKNTSKFVTSVLSDLGINFRDGIAGTGVIAEIQGKDPGARLVALRGDMDALPIQEDNDVSYRSQNDGKMHACGHDVHTSSLLGVAKILKSIENEFTGTARLIFQPGEEQLPGGASLMIKEGALSSPTPSSIFGQHVFPELPSGKVGFRPGMYMASCDEIYITIKGKGGHAAMPHKNIDPIVISAQVITGLQQLVARAAKATIPTVLSFGAINGGFATNVTPNEVKLMGTLRTFDEEWRYKAHQWIENFVFNTCQAAGGSADIDIRVGYPHLKNNESLTLGAKSIAQSYLSAENVVDLDLRMTAEDFAYYTHETSGCFYRLGTDSADGQFRAPVHNSKFNIDESALETGMGLMTYLAVSQ